MYTIKSSTRFNQFDCIDTICDLFLKICYSVSEAELDEALLELKGKDLVAWKYILGFDLDHWATARFKGRRFGNVSNNLAESTNNLVGKITF